MSEQQIQPQSIPPVNGACEPCVFLLLKLCTGLRDGTLFNCFHTCCHDKNGCDEVCPNNARFSERIAEIRGLGFGNVEKIAQRDVDLPLYVPHINHHYSRTSPLSWPFVAITPYTLFRMRQNVYTAQVDSPESLRTYFHLEQAARVILLGIDKDKPLEKYWSYSTRDHAPEQLQRLGIDLVIGPNFSHFVDVPRTDNIYNRKRQLLCLEHMQAAGLNVVPHLSIASEGDWHFWDEYVSGNPQITYVAKEFQTGNKRLKKGQDTLSRIEAIQQHSGRALHPILIGGSRLTEQAAAMFKHFTVIDSRPFMNSVHRHSFTSKGKRPMWKSDRMLPCFGIDDLLSHNLSRYSLWLALRAQSVMDSKRHRRAG